MSEYPTRPTGDRKVHWSGSETDGLPPAHTWVPTTPGAWTCSDCGDTAELHKPKVVYDGPPLNLYLVTGEYDEVRYDAYYGFVVAATSEDEARAIPATQISYKWEWPESQDDVKVTLIGTAAPNVEPGVISVDYNRG